MCQATIMIKEGIEIYFRLLAEINILQQLFGLPMAYHQCPEEL